jgi:hypothetical protein
MSEYKLFTCEGKGGTYELLGIAKPEYPLSIPLDFAKLGTTIGAGHSRTESFVVHQGPNGILVYERDISVFGVSYTPRVIYRDVVSQQLFHREQKDFDNRMIPVTE